MKPIMPDTTLATSAMRDILKIPEPRLSSQNTTISATIATTAAAGNRNGATWRLKGREDYVGKHFCQAPLMVIARRLDSRVGVTPDWERKRRH